MFVKLPESEPLVQVRVCETDAQLTPEGAVEEYAVFEYPVDTFPHGVPVQPFVQL